MNSTNNDVEPKFGDGRDDRIPSNTLMNLLSIFDISFGDDHRSFRLAEAAIMSSFSLLCHPLKQVAIDF